MHSLKIEYQLSVSPKNKIQIISEDSSDKIKRLSRSIGIESKFVCQKGELFSDLAKKGIDYLFDNNFYKANDFDGIIVVTQSPDYIIPGTAVLLQDRCGLNKNILAYDINLGCSGYPYALHVGYGHLLSGMKKILLVVGDQSYSPGTTDDGHNVLFGDGCSITAISVDQDFDHEYHFIPGTDGRGYESLYIPYGGKRNPINAEALKPKLDHLGVIRTGTDVILDGPNILTFSVGTVPGELKKMQELTGWGEQVDYYFLHQANKMINSTIMKKMKGSNDQFPESLSDHGNTSSASIPITMTARGSGKWNKAGAKNILCGFGIGLSWATLSYKASGDEISNHIYV